MTTYKKFTKHNYCAWSIAVMLIMVILKIIVKVNSSLFQVKDKIYVLSWIWQLSQTRLSLWRIKAFVL